ncbi:MAG TPA: hypothetical protein VN200_03605 [Rhodoglobus sp.]|nr:hypothetical protein [Rhodoglobus sp.]
MSRTRILRDRLVTPDAVYGTILFVSVVAASADDGTDTPGVWSVLLFAVVTQLVFFLAHVFAGSVAGHGAHGEELVPLRTAIGRASRHSLGLLYGPVLPAIPLVLGALGVLAPDDAEDLTLYVAMVILGVLGYLALGDHRIALPWRILGGVGAALLGLVIIVLNLLVH